MRQAGLDPTTSPFGPLTVIIREGPVYVVHGPDYHSGQIYLTGCGDI